MFIFPLTACRTHTHTHLYPDVLHEQHPHAIPVDQGIRILLSLNCVRTIIRITQHIMHMNIGSSLY